MKWLLFISSVILVYYEFRSNFIRRLFQPVETLQAHAQLFDYVVVHLDSARTTGVLASDAIAAKLRNKLETLQSNIYTSMCELKIALRSQGSDFPVLDPTPLDSLFSQLTGSYTNEMYRTYILMNDSERLASYLHDIYSAIISSLK